jgi:hypothetical protein
LETEPGTHCSPLASKLLYGRGVGWGNGETETKPFHYAYEFYVGEYGEWNAKGMGPVK